MSLALKNNIDINWRPLASQETLVARANILHRIRTFFAGKKVLEVETPLLSASTITDPYIQAIEALPGLFLQTSPEYAMKRLLAAGSGPIFQLCKAFRQEESGRLHHVEFTILEWYQPNFNHHDLMEEVDELLQLILKTKKAQKINYHALFEMYFKINPSEVTLNELSHLIQHNNIHLTSPLADIDTGLTVLLSHCIEPHLGQTEPVFIYDFPASQSALAKIRNENPKVASRFEVYFKGIELGNGFHELQDAKEQRSRFEQNLLQRKQSGLSLAPIDEAFLQALEYGLPDCSGIAIGIDRLIMLALGIDHIAAVMSFI